MYTGILHVVGRFSDMAIELLYSHIQPILTATLPFGQRDGDSLQT